MFWRGNTSDEFTKRLLIVERNAQVLDPVQVCVTALNFLFHSSFKCFCVLESTSGAMVDNKGVIISGQQLCFCAGL